MPGKPILQHVRVALALAVLGCGLVGGFAGDATKADALPDGALKRLGSQRWRHGEPITFIALPRDGKTLVTAGQDAILHLWDRETGQELRRFVPAANQNGKAGAPVDIYMYGLTRAAMSGDGRLLAVVVPGNMVQLWEVATGKALRQIKYATTNVASLSLTPDGKTLIVRGVNDRTAFLYEAETGKEIRTLKPLPPNGKRGNIFGGAGDGTAVAISADGKTIALSELDYDGKKVSGSVTLFDLDTGKQIRRIDSATNGISSVAFSADGKTLAFNTHSTIHWIEVATGKEIRQIQAVNGANLLSFSPDGQTLAVKGRDQLVRLYDANNGKLVRTLGGPPGLQGGLGVVINGNGATITDVVFSGDGKTLIIGGQQMPRFFDVATGKEQVPAGGGHRGAVAALRVDVDGKTIVSRGGEGVLRIWNAVTGEETRQVPEPAGTSAIHFAPDGKLVALGNNDGTVRLLDLADGKQKRQLKAHQGTVATVAFSPDGKRLATRGSYDGLLKIFDVEKGIELKQVALQNLPAGNGGNAVMVVRRTNGQRDSHPLAFSPDGKTLATFIAPQQVLVQGRQQVQPDSNCLCFFDVGTGKEIRQIPMPAGRSVNQLVFSLDGRLVISENLDKTVSLWEVASGQERRRLGDPIAAPTQMSSSFVVINGIARSGPPMAPLGVTIATSHEGSLIACPGANHAIQVFDTWLGKRIGSFEGHNGAVASLVFAADDKTLVSGSNDSTLLVWDLSHLKRTPRPQIAKIEPKNFDRVWAELLSSDAGKAGQTIHTLIASSDEAVALLQDRLQPVAPVDAKKVDQWLRDLDSSNFTKRAIAANELEKLSELAIPALQKVLAAHPSLEIRRRVEPMLEELTGRNLTTEQLRIVRAIEVLDRIGTGEARQLLERLAAGAAGSLTTLQAQGSLDRLILMKK